MRTRIAFFLAGLFIAGVGLGFKQATEFRPPRTGVVSITRVFTDYQKKIDQQTILDKELASLKAENQRLVDSLKEVESELRLMKRGPERDEKERELGIGKINLEQFQRTQLESFKRRYIAILREIREEISDEIKKYAEIMDLDLVLEETVEAEDPSGPPLRWPIVHYAKPELDITSVITDRLNERYRNVRTDQGPRPR